MVVILYPIPQYNTLVHTNTNAPHHGPTTDHYLRLRINSLTSSVTVSYWSITAAIIS